MKEKMRILVLSQPVWINENNGGNTMTNIFSGFPAEFANIYFSEGLPDNGVCRRYYQVSDYMVLQHLLKGSKIGKAFEEGDKPQQLQPGFEKKAKTHKNPFTLMLRELAWKVTKVDTEDLYGFIRDFHPDLIYAPCYGNFRMLRILRQIKAHVDVPLVSYISDDLYNYREEDKNPVNYLMRYYLRRSLRKTFAACDLVYTMTEEQQQEYSQIFSKPLRILRKNQMIPYIPHVRQNPMHIIYAGGLYGGREASLCRLAEVVRRMNQTEKKFILDVYSFSGSSHPDILNDRISSFLHPGLPYEELMKEYQKADIALHIESFAKNDMSYARLSFSTKIVDCLQSGCPVLAVCPSSNAGFRYLRRENAAVCIDSLDHIESGLAELDKNYSHWQEQALKCLNKNHNKTENQQKLFREFDELIASWNPAE